MKVLAFDTSSVALSVALLDGERLMAEQVLGIKKNHSVSLMPTIDFLMQQVGWLPSDLDRIVVAEGPGSYTGLRMAVATAKTLAYTLAIDLVGVSSLQALCLDSDALYISLIDARRNHVYVGFYQNGKAVKPDSYDSFLDVLEWASDKENVVFVGEVDPFRNQIAAALPNAGIQETLPSASKLGEIGLSLPPVPVHAFVPRYLKKVEAEEVWLESHVENGESYIKRV